MRRVFVVLLVALILAAYSWASEDSFQLASRSAGLASWSAMQWEAGR